MIEGVFSMFLVVAYLMAIREEKNRADRKINSVIHTTYERPFQLVLHVG